METTTYGPHLVIDAYGCDPLALNDVGLIRRFLDTLPTEIGMQVLSPAHVVSVANVDIAGVTGVVLITTSHISLHSYTLKGCLWMDVFSCKPFEERVVLRRIEETFRPTRVETQTLQRGVSFPLSNIHPADILEEA